MGMFTTDIKNLDDLFVHTLQDIYYAEQKIANGLGKMIDKASDGELKRGFQQHQAETRNHVMRLEEVFKLHGQTPKAIDCPAIDGIVEEAEDVAGDSADGAVRDAALIASAQSVEHYEIARYGTLIEWARQLGKDDCAALLQQNLDEEKATDKKLTMLAERRINPMSGPAASA